MGLQFQRVRVDDSRAKAQQQATYLVTALSSSEEQQESWAVHGGTLCSLVGIRALARDVGSILGIDDRNAVQMDGMRRARKERVSL